jgi:hypothetical protein
MSIDTCECETLYFCFVYLSRSPNEFISVIEICPFFRVSTITWFLIISSLRHCYQSYLVIDNFLRKIFTFIMQEWSPDKGQTEGYNQNKKLNFIFHHLNRFNSRKFLVFTIVLELNNLSHLFIINLKHPEH